MKRILFLCILLLALTACQHTQPPVQVTEPEMIHIPTTETIELAQISHTRIEGYSRVFDLAYYQSEGLSLGFEVDLYDSDTMGQYINQMDLVLYLLEQELGLDTQPIQVYVIDDLGQSDFFQTQDRLYISKSFLESEDYKALIIKEALGLPRLWQAYGLLAYLEQSPYDTHTIRAYYSQPDRIDALSLSDFYFLGPFNDTEALSYSKAAANALTHYIMETSGIDALLEGNIKDQVNWIQSLNLYHEPPFEIILNTYAYIYGSSVTYPLTVHTDTFDFYIEPLVDDHTYGLSDASHIENYVYLTTMNYDHCKNLILNTGGLYSQGFQTDMHFSIYFQNDYQSQVNINQGMTTITFGADGFMTSGLSNNLCQIIMPNTTELWSMYALSEYLTAGINPYTLGFSHFKADLSLHPYVGDYFDHKQLTSYADVADNMRYYYDAMALETFEPSQEVNLFAGSPLRDILTYADPSITNAEPYALTIIQLSSLTAYLVDAYGLESVLGVYTGQSSFEETFNVSFDTIQAKWIDYLHSDKILVSNP